MLEDGGRIFAVDIDAVEEGELGTRLRCEVDDLLIGGKLLVAELCTRKSQDLKAIWAVFLSKRREFFIMALR